MVEIPQVYRPWIMQQLVAAFELESHRALLNDAVPVGVNESGGVRELVIEVSSDFHANMLAQPERLNPLLGALSELGEQVPECLSVTNISFKGSGKVPQLGLITAPEPAVAQTRRPQPPRTTGRDVDEVKLDYESIPPFDSETFGNLVVHPGSVDAMFAAYRLATKTGEKFSQLTVWGKSGTGKSAILSTTAMLRRKYHPEDVVVETTGEDFVNSLIASFRSHTTDEFRQKHRRCDLYVVDDAEEIFNISPKSVEELFRTLRALGACVDVQILLAFPDRPGSYGTDQVQLRTRLEQGIVKRISYPEQDVLVRMLKKWSQEQQVWFCEEVLEAVVAVVENNPRVMHGALISLCSYNSLHGEVSADMVEGILGEDYSRNGASRIVTLPEIAEFIAEKHELEVDDLRSPKRGKQFDAPRQYFCYLARELTQLTYAKIGKFLSDRDHSTVKYAYDQINNAIVEEGDSVLKQLMEEYKASIRG